MENNVKNLPIFKHFTDSEIGAKVDQFRKGEFTLYQAIKLIAAGILGYLLWIYVLPPVFIMLGKMFAIAATAVFLVFLVIAAPVILKGLRSFTRFLHKNVIKHDPFGSLAEQRVVQVQQQQNFRMAEGKIKTLKEDCELNANNSEKEAKANEDEILKMQVKANKIKNRMEEIIKEKGPSGKDDDEYFQLNLDFTKITSNYQRVQHLMEQNKLFVSKYGVRALNMKKFGQKLQMVGTAMEIKLLDFDATVIILKKDFEYAESSRIATQAAKEAMMFETTWEVEYAIDVVTSTISNDIAITSGNLKDIDTLTSQYSINSDSEELFNSLNKLADNIKIGSDVTPTAKQYQSESYIPTQQDRLNSGGFQDFM